MARTRHVEVWTAWPFKAGAARVGSVILTARGGRTTRRVGGERQKTFQLPIGDNAAPDGSEAKAHADAFAAVLPNRVLRFVAVDGTFAEWLVLDVDDASSGDGLATVTCVGLSGALQRAPAIRLTDAEGRATFRFDGVGLTLAQHWSAYIAPRLAEVGLDFIELGTDETAGAKDVAYNGEDPWEAVKQLAATFGKELDISRDDGTSTYKVHFVTRVGSGLTGPRLAAAENASITRRRSVVPQRTRLDGIGADGCTIGDAVWIVASKATNVIGLADPAGGPGPILRDDQLNGLYLEAANRTTRVQVTDCVGGATQTVTLTSGSAFTIGDRVRFRADSAGTRIVSLEDPVEVATHGVLAGTHRREDIPETVNLVPNADMAIWTGGPSDPADGWAAVKTPTLTRTTDAQHVQSGGKSCRVQTNEDGEGLAGPLVTVQPTALQPYGAGCLNIKLVSGRIRIEMVATDGVSSWILPDGITQKAIPDLKALGVFRLDGVSGILLKDLGATAVRMRVVQDGTGTAEFYVDACQVTESGGQLPLVFGAGPTQLWQAVNDQLALVAPTSVRLEGRPVDFHRLDPAAHPDHRFLLGATHEVVVPRLGLVDGVRVLEITEEDDTEAQTELTLSSLPEDLRSLQVRRAAIRQAAVTNAPILGGVRTITDAQMLAPDQMISPSQAGFTAADVGKTVWILGGGTNGTVLKTTIAALHSTSPTIRCTLATSVQFQGSGMTAIIGTAEQVATIGAEIGGKRAGGLLENDTGRVRPSAKDWQDRAIDRFFAKVANSDSDWFDSILDGPTYIKVIPFLTIEAEQNSITPTTVVVDITATDPSGGAAPSIAHNGGGAVTGANPYTIARPSAGSGPLLVTFTASKTGRVSQTVVVTVPEQAPGGGTVPPSIDAFYVTGGQDNTNDTIPLAWSVSNPPSGATYDIAWDHNGSWRTAGGVATGVGGSPLDFNTATYGDADLVTKGTGGYETVVFQLQLRMKDSGGTIVATRDISITVFAKETPP